MIVTYVGKSDTRIIRDTDFTAAGLSHSTVTWNKANGYSIDIPPDIASFVLAQGSEFIAEPASTFGTVIAGVVHDHSGYRRPFFRSGSWYGFDAGRPGVRSLTPNRLYAMPFFVPRTITVSAIGVNVTVAGGSGTVIRLGIYSDIGSGGGGFPGSLLLDAGTVNGAAVVAISKAISQVLDAGLYWLASVAQNVSGGNPTVSAVDSANAAVGCTGSTGLESACSGGGQGILGTPIDVTSGALPNPFGTGTNSGQIPSVAVLVA